MLIRQRALPDATDCLKASRISGNRSLGNARETLNRCRQETAVDVNLAFWVLQAIKNGEQNCGRLDKSLQLRQLRSCLLSQDCLTCRNLCFRCVGQRLQLLKSFLCSCSKLCVLALRIRDQVSQFYRQNLGCHAALRTNK